MIDKSIKFQQRFFKLSSDLKVIVCEINKLNKEDLNKYIDKNILKSCLFELKYIILPNTNRLLKKLGQPNQRNKE